ncbi:hypothetical protein F2P56_022798 [Juglans regia]|uniref:Reverse transcriptase Ty1/copia-type domain-containing protein n=2 Tax=Juglans regia TaxID=51240 RepID=A0A833UJF1_JUGRE|nr:uncharacterized mitochondrial protein AtMg00810-like [Juglans regia]KAF5458793.1 hypothetical protein F2P56_022798 [Juglans regia]
MDAYFEYNQIRMNPKDEEKTLFTTDRGMYSYTTMPFGLKIAETTYQRLVNPERSWSFKVFLGLEVTKFVKGISLSQREYAFEIVSDSGLLAGKLATCPMEQNLRLPKSDSVDPLLDDPASYRRLISHLLYLTLTRLDLSYSVNTLSQFLDQPRQSHYDAAIKVVRYVKATTGQGLFFSRSSSLQLIGFYDSDWPTCPDP